MVQIDISLLPTLPSPTINVNPDPSSAHTDDAVLWVFHSFDPTITSVEIVWKNASESYFFPRKATGIPAKSIRTDLIAGGATIWGRAPSLGMPGSRSSDYTINAYDSPSATLPVYSLDPTVITEQP
jgi:hypothetical protein